MIRTDKRFQEFIHQARRRAPSDHWIQVADLFSNCLNHAIWAEQDGLEAQKVALQLKEFARPKDGPGPVRYSFDHLAAEQRFAKLQQEQPLHFGCYKHAILHWLLHEQPMDNTHEACRARLGARDLWEQRVARGTPSGIGHWLDEDWLTHIRSNAEALIGRSDQLERHRSWLTAALQGRRPYLLTGEKGVGKSLFIDQLLQQCHDHWQHTRRDLWERTRFVLIRPIAAVLLAGEVDRELEQLNQWMSREPAIVPVFDEFDAFLANDAFRLAFSEFFGGILAHGGRSLVFVSRSGLAAQQIAFRDLEERRLPELDFVSTVTVAKRLLPAALRQRSLTLAPDLEPRAFCCDVARFAALYQPMISQPAGTTDLLEKTADQAEERARQSGARPGVVTLDDLIAAVSLEANVEKELLAADPSPFFAKVKEQLGREIIGQEHAVSRICQRLQKWESRIRDVGTVEEAAERHAMRLEPLRFLLVGPSGIGKTETARALARHLHRPLHIFPMNQYSTEMGRTSFVGSDPGYERSGQTDTIFTAVRDSSRCVILLDEIEKAHLDVQNILLGILEGEGKDFSGKKVSFGQTIFIMTSNYAETAISDNYVRRRESANRDQAAEALTTRQVKSLLQQGVAAEVEQEMLAFLKDRKQRLADDFRNLRQSLPEKMGPEHDLPIAELRKLIDEHLSLDASERQLRALKQGKSIGSALLDRAHEIIPYLPLVKNGESPSFKGGDDSTIITQLVMWFAQRSVADDQVRELVRGVPSLATVRDIKSLVEQSNLS